MFVEYLHDVVLLFIVITLLFWTITIVLLLFWRLSTYTRQIIAIIDNLLARNEIFQIKKTTILDNSLFWYYPMHPT